MITKTTRCYFAMALVLLVTQIIGCSAGGGRVTLPKTAFTVGGKVTGLAGGNIKLILQNNGGDTVTMTANGDYRFGGLLANGATYSVLVNTAPTGMTCDVANGSGTVAGADVTNVNVSCAATATTYTIGGTLSGLMASKKIVLQNNGGNDITLTREGGFTFGAQAKEGAAYNVTVLTPPANQSCTVSGGTGVVAAAPVNNISVVCVIDTGPTELRVGFATKQLNFNWPERRGATHYQLFEKTSAIATPVQVGGDISGSTFAKTVAIEAIHFFDWKNMRYFVKACDASACFDSNELTLADASAKAVGYFKASNTNANDYFGWAIALSADGNTLAVGAPNEDSKGTAIEPPAASNQSDNSIVDSGAVYVFSRDTTSGVWSQQAYIKASNASAGDLFGISVALSADGNTLAVGAINEDGNAASTNLVPNDAAVNAGAAYVFTRSGTTWTQQAYVKPLVIDAGDGFGYKLALSGDGNTMAVGAIYEDSNSAAASGDNSAQDSGAVYVFTRSGVNWSQEQYLKAANVGAGDFFGFSIALNKIDGNTLAVGAMHEDGSVASTMGVPNDAATNAGAVYVFFRNAGAWSQQEYLKASNAEVGDNFGYSVALSEDGNKLAVGALYEDGSSTGINNADNNNATDSGAAYVFSRTGVTWGSPPVYIKASNTEADDGFGYAVALNPEGDTLAVGAYHEAGSAVGIDGVQTTNASPTSGAVYVYSYVSGAWAQTPVYVKASNGVLGDYFGSAVSLSQNRGSQKENTLAVGAYAESGGTTGVVSTRSAAVAPFAGAVYLY